MRHCPHCLQPVFPTKSELLAALEVEHMQCAPRSNPTEQQLAERVALAKQERKRFYDPKAAKLVRQVELVEQLRRRMAG